MIGFRGKYSIEAMCEVFEVSRSGSMPGETGSKKKQRISGWLTWSWCASGRASRPMAFAAFDAGFSARLEKLVNVKAILRVMRKLNLLSVVRRRRPYTRYQQAVHKYPNLLDRNFDQAKPNQFWVTDITYIPIPGRCCTCALYWICVERPSLRGRSALICRPLWLQTPSVRL